MRVVEPGHIYEVENADGTGTQRIEFVQRRGPDGESLDPARRHEGILSQELLRVLIDRTLYLYAEAPCDEDTEIVDALRLALVRYETRAARRAVEKLSKPENADVCPICRHILCGHQRALHARAIREVA